MPMLQFEMGLGGAYGHNSKGALLFDLLELRYFGQAHESEKRGGRQEPRT